MHFPTPHLHVYYRYQMNGTTPSSPSSKKLRRNSIIFWDSFVQMAQGTITSVPPDVGISHLVPEELDVFYIITQNYATFSFAGVWILLCWELWDVLLHTIIAVIFRQKKKMIEHSLWDFSLNEFPHTALAPSAGGQDTRKGIAMSLLQFKKGSRVNPATKFLFKPICSTSLTHISPLLEACTAFLFITLKRGKPLREGSPLHFLSCMYFRKTTKTFFSLLQSRFLEASSENEEV